MSSDSTEPFATPFLKNTMMNMRMINHNYIIEM